MATSIPKLREAARAPRGLDSRAQRSTVAAEASVDPSSTKISSYGPRGASDSTRRRCSSGRLSSSSSTGTTTETTGRGTGEAALTAGAPGLRGPAARRASACAARGAPRPRGRCARCASPCRRTRAGVRGTPRRRSGGRSGRRPRGRRRGCRSEHGLRQLVGPPSHSAPVTPSPTVSSAPPALLARTGRPAAWASTAAMPNSSTAVTTRARQVASRSAATESSTRPVNFTLGAARRRSEPQLRSTADHRQGQTELVEGPHRGVDPLVGHELREHQVVAPPPPRARSARCPRVGGGPRTSRPK